MKDNAIKLVPILNFIIILLEFILKLSTRDAIIITSITLHISKIDKYFETIFGLTEKLLTK